ncbi:MAG: permease [Candidatus Marinimicrobia bacterium]|nr:permease [Candidatus Neomarinimicrobiota bacterium]MBL7022841.1 permease [Candidatus Neomarinimicrobiota bacterium]MBL7109438.1 permease [Candidatus Neomarinimicrobiota bacterium]
MIWKKEIKTMLIILGVFLGFYFFPDNLLELNNPLTQAVALVKWYAREHIILCLIPAFFIAGAMAVFLNKNVVMKYLGAKANKFVAYCVASISGSVLAVCSCTILPLFAGIYKMGAGLGPATAFLYAGPAINVLAIILTSSVLGIELGIARAVGAILFSIVIGLLMSFIFRKENQDEQESVIIESEKIRPLYQTSIYFALMILILVVVNWSCGTELSSNLCNSSKWIITSLLAMIFVFVLGFWFKVAWWKLFSVTVLVTIVSAILPDTPTIPFVIAIAGLTAIISTGNNETKDWLNSTWEFTRQIIPLLFIGVLIAGFLLGNPEGGGGIIPPHWISSAVGGNSIGANLFSAVAGAFMYFATLTEIPILQGLLNNGMGKGPALALLLAGPALSIPNMLVIRSVLGNKKTIVFVLLTVIMATVTGYIYGNIF